MQGPPPPRIVLGGRSPSPLNLRPCIQETGKYKLLNEERNLCRLQICLTIMRAYGPAFSDQIRIACIRLNWIILDLYWFYNGLDQTRTIVTVECKCVLIARLLVGAPKANVSWEPNVTEPGTVYKCRLADDTIKKDLCTELRMDVGQYRSACL